MARKITQSKFSDQSQPIESGLTAFLLQKLKLSAVERGAVIRVVFEEVFRLSDLAGLQMRICPNLNFELI